MSIQRLSLVVFALLAGTAASVRSYLESRQPITLSPRILVRELPAGLRADPGPEAPWSAPAGFEADGIEVLDAPSAETLSAMVPAREPALLVELSPRTSAASTSRWIKVRRDGLGRIQAGAPWAPARAADACEAEACAPSSCRPASAPAGASVAGPPACVRPD